METYEEFSSIGLLSLSMHWHDESPNPNIHSEVGKACLYEIASIELSREWDSYD